MDDDWAGRVLLCLPNSGSGPRSGRPRLAMERVRPAHPLPAGHLLAEGDVAFRRPGTGLPPKAVDWLVGRTLADSIAMGVVFQPGHFLASS